MQRRKIVIATLSLLLVGLSLSSANINKAHAFLNSHSLAIGNVLISVGGNLPPGVGIEAVQGGTSLTVTANVQGSLFTPSYQRNITIGFKADWMQNYQNASIFTLTSGQISSTSFSVSVPSTTGIIPSQHWNVQAWDGPSSGNIANCDPNNSENNPGGIKTSCISLGNGSIAILTSDQYAAAQARNNAESITTSVGSLNNNAANAQLAQANSEEILGDQAWLGGDFSGAKTHYQNAQNDANGALATAYNLNGGQSNSLIISPILAATGTIMFGLGGLLAGLGGFFYLKRRPKA